MKRKKPLRSTPAKSIGIDEVSIIEIGIDEVSVIEMRVRGRVDVRVRREHSKK